MGRGPQSEKNVSTHHSFLSAHLADSHAGCGLISCSLWLFSVFPFSPNRFLPECVQAFLPSRWNCEVFCEMTGKAEEASQPTQVRHPLKRERAFPQRNTNPAAGKAAASHNGAQANSPSDKLLHVQLCHKWQSDTF